MNKKDISDELIVRNVQQGRTEYFSMIVERYRNKIYGIGMRFFYNHDDSADFTQEVFLRAYDRIHSYREIAPFRFWLTKLAYNLGINMKKNIPDEKTSIDDIAEPFHEESPEGVHIYHEVKKVLIDEINRLPERYRVCLDLYFFMGLKYTEISEITGFPVNTIKSDVFRAKNILRQIFAGTIAEEVI
jgi:RNA polymerase sigma-70 factor (ECF subfamily)